MTKKWQTVAIVGVGLIGGSIGLALRERKLAERIIGIGRRASSLKRAQQCGAVTETNLQVARGVAEAQLTIVCTPVASIAAHIREVAADCPAGALITDAGSTKAQIVAEVGSSLPSGVAFVGSHPLAGGEKTGPEAARPDLFQDRAVIVTPTRRSRPPDVQRIKQFWTSLGARVETMSPDAHDAAVATTSHVPHLVASLLAAATPEKYLELVASGWLDTTRVAAGDVQLWTQILRDNRANVLKSLDKFATKLNTVRRALETDNEVQLARILKVGKEHRDAVGN